MNIIVDSGCDLDNEYLELNGMDLVPITLFADGRHFTDDGELDIEAYTQAMAQSKSAPKTAAPAPELFLDKIKNLTGSAFVVTLSSHLSSSYSNAMLAKKTYLEEIGKKFIHVFDSLSASAGEMLVAMKIKEFIRDNIAENEIVERINHFIKEMRTYFVLERYTNLMKSGRINPYIAGIASILSIKPICRGTNGKIEIAEKIRGANKALIRLVNIITGDTVDFGNRTLAIAHSNCIEKALFLKEEVMKRVRFKDCIISRTRGTCTTYADREGIVVAY